LTLRLGIVMDPIETITVAKDSSLAMLLAAQRRGWSLHYMLPGDLYLHEATARARSRELQVQDDPLRWYEFGGDADIALHSLDVVLMRKDPPFDMDYIYTTYLLELAEARGTLVVNRPSALRDANEKLFTAWFPELTPATLVTCEQRRLRDFLDAHGDIVVKPLDGMCCTSVFRVQRGDPNVSVIFETITNHQKLLAMAQVFIPQISEGDKRILLIDGEPIPFALARIPAPGESRGNLASGGRGESRQLSKRDYEICRQVAPKLVEKGLIFVGLDVIGDHLTEINVTSPTCIRELERENGIDIAGKLLDSIEQHRHA
jgi:glutathione synthase